MQITQTTLDQYVDGQIEIVRRSTRLRAHILSIQLRPNNDLIVDPAWVAQLWSNGWFEVKYPPSAFVFDISKHIELPLPGNIYHFVLPPGEVIRLLPKTVELLSSDDVQRT